MINIICTFSRLMFTALRFTTSVVSTVTAVKITMFTTATTGIGAYYCGVMAFLPGTVYTSRATVLVPGSLIVYSLAF